MKAPKTGPRRPREPPRRFLDASRGVPGAAKTPQGRPPGRPRCLPGSPRASKTAPGASKAPPGALQGRLLDPPGSSQEPSRRAFSASSWCPAASSLWPASGLGGKREALTISIQFAVPGGVLDPERFDVLFVLPRIEPRRGQSPAIVLEKLGLQRYQATMLKKNAATQSILKFLDSQLLRFLDS